MEAPMEQPRSFEAAEDAIAVVQEKFLDFLEAWGEDDDADRVSSQTADGEEPTQPRKIYVDQTEAMREAQKTTLYVDFEHLKAYDADLAELIKENHYRAEVYLRKAVQNFVRNHEEAYAADDSSGEKEFWLSLYNLDHTDTLRDLKTGKIGKLSCFSGTVTRTSEVRPELFLGTFRCMECQTLIKGVQQQFRYTQPMICPNVTCGNR